MSTISLSGMVVRAGAVFGTGAGLVALAALAERALPTLGDGESLLSVGWYNFLLLPWLAVAVEMVIVGWRRSALRNLLVGRSDSARSDLAYQFLALSGASELLLRISLLGLVAWAERVSERDIGLLPLNELPLWLALPVIWLVASFMGYWEHRMMHSRWLWTLHKSHHSPTEFTLINIFRTHPMEFALAAVGNSIPMALLGFAPEHLAIFWACFFFNPLFLHSHWTWTRWLERFGICTPAGHRLHHGIAEEHHDRNFGELTNIWDKLFGTYVAPDADVDQVKIGVDALPGRHNTSNPFREIALQTMDWLATVKREARSAFRQAGQAQAIEP